MVPDESMAYAIATWARFNADVTDDLLRALSAAFALVAAADGEIARSEVDEFVQLLRGKADVFSGIDFNALEVTFRDLTESLVADPEQGRLRACESIADGRLRAPEEAAMQQICTALGLETPT